MVSCLCRRFVSNREPRAFKPQSTSEVPAWGPGDLRPQLEAFCKCNLSMQGKSGGMQLGLICHTAAPLPPEISLGSATSPPSLSANSEGGLLGCGKEPLGSIPNSIWMLRGGQRQSSLSNESCLEESLCLDPRDRFWPGIIFGVMQGFECRHDNTSLTIEH